MNADVVVIGAGTVGAAIGYGLACHNVRVLVIDGGDRDFRAANANFGLVWQHGKGIDLPEYHGLTKESVDLWPDFSRELTDLTSVDLQYEQDGGLFVTFGETEYEQRRTDLMRLHNQVGGKPDWEMLDRYDLAQMLTDVQLGPDVTGASLGRRDGQANPLRLLAALHEGIVRRGGWLRGGCPVRAIQSDRAGGFSIIFGEERVSAARLVIAAGLGSKALAAQVGLDIPVRPQRGQILVTERLAPFLPLPMMNVRQTREGTIMIGATNEEAGFDASTTCEAAASLSVSALRCIPALHSATLVRQWAGLRIMTPDGFPIYEESESHPGAFIAQCHSGVTLAAIHATLVADAIVQGRLPPSLNVFHKRRFNVPEAA